MGSIADSPEHQTEHRVGDPECPLRREVGVVGHHAAPGVVDERHDIDRDHRRGLRADLDPPRRFHRDRFVTQREVPHRRGEVGQVASRWRPAARRTPATSTGIWRRNPTFGGRVTTVIALFHRVAETTLSPSPTSIASRLERLGIPRREYGEDHVEIELCEVSRPIRSHLVE